MKLNLALLNIRAFTNKSFFINDLVSEHKLDFIFLTETWLNSDGASLLIEASPPNYSFICFLVRESVEEDWPFIFSDTFKYKCLNFGSFESFEYQAIILETQTSDNYLSTTKVYNLFLIWNLWTNLCLFY